MQPQNSQEALAQLQGTQKKTLSPNKILQQQEKKLGVGEAQKTVTGLRAAIDNTTKLLKQVAPSVMGRTQNSLVTNAQAVGQIQNAQAPIAQNLSEQGAQYGTAQQDLGTLQERAAKTTQGVYQGQQDKLGYLQNLYNTLYGREQAETQRQEAQRQFNEELALRKAQQEEQIRQFNEQLAESRRSSGSGGASSFSFAPTQTAQPAAQKSLRETWQEEANNGDGNAQVALNYAGDDGRYDGPVNSSREFNILKSMGIQGEYYISPKSSSNGLSVSSASLPKIVNSSGLTVRL